MKFFEWRVAGYDIVFTAKLRPATRRRKISAAVIECGCSQPFVCDRFLVLINYAALTFSSFSEGDRFLVGIHSSNFVSDFRFGIWDLGVDNFADKFLEQ